MSNCIDDNALVEFVEGTLPSDESKHVESHVLRCLPCRRRLIAVGAAPSRLAEAPTAPAGIGAHLDLQPGTKVGRFEVCHEIGRGGMGIVFAARDHRLERSVALKLLHCASSSAEQSAQAQERLLAEARAMARLGHPNIITVFEAGTFRHETYIAMELVHGDTLNQWLRRWDRSWSAILEAFKQAGSALAHAHEHGIAHGDFKPENVLIDDKDQVRVTDFGLARWFGESHPQTELDALSTDPASKRRHPLLMGTPRYMAPEQFAGRPADARSDQLAFCVALYEALYGRHPFLHDTALSLLKLPQEQALAPMRQDAHGDHGIPPWLHNALIKGLSPNPGYRYNSMRELLQALTPPVVRAPRTRIVAAMTAALIIVCLVGYSFGAWRSEPSSAARPSLERPGSGSTGLALPASDNVSDPRDDLAASGNDRGDDEPVAEMPLRTHGQQSVFGTSKHLSPASNNLVEGLRTLLDSEIGRVEKRLDALRKLRDTVARLTNEPGPDDHDDDPALLAVKADLPTPTRDADNGAIRSSHTDDVAKPEPPEASHARKNGLSSGAIARSVDQRWRDLEVCFQEWRERQPTNVRRILRVRMHIDRRGQARVERMRGLGDKVVRKCVAGALEAVSFPRARHSTEVELRFRSEARKLFMVKKLVRRQ